MAPPSTAGLVVLLDDENPSSFDVSANNLNSTPTVSINSNELQIRSISYSTGDRYFEIPLASILNLNTHSVVFAHSTTIVRTNYMRFGFRSGTTPNTNYKVWDVGHESTNVNFDLFTLLGGNAAGGVEAGIFDPTDCQAFRVEWQRSSTGQNNKIFALQSSMVSYPNDTGIIVAGGELGDPANLSYARNVQSGASRDIFDESLSSQPTSGFSSGHLIAASVSLGTGDPSELIEIDTELVQFVDPNERVRETNRILRINSANVLDPAPSFTLKGSPTGQDSFIEASGAVQDYSVIFEQLVSANLRISNFSGSFRNFSGPVTGGGIVRNTFTNFNTTYAYIWTENSDLRMNFDSANIQYGILAHGDNFTDGATLNLSNVEFTQNPTVNKIAVDATGKTLNIDPGASGITESDVTVLNGTINFLTVATTFTASSLTSPIFNNVRARLSLVPGSPVQVNENGTVASGGINFDTTAVNTTNNTITVSGISGKLNTSSTIRFFGSDVPAPIDTRAVYYPSIDYAGGNDLTISTSPGGATLVLTDVGSGSDMYVSPWTELDITLLTSGSYVVDLATAAASKNVTIANGDVLTLQAIHHETPGTGGSSVLSHYIESNFQFNSVSITTLETLSQATNPMALLSEINLDGSQVTGYVFDSSTPAKVQIDTAKTIVDTRELVAYFYYVQWTEPGLRLIRGNIDVENLNSISILGELTFDANATTEMKGPFTYRLDGKNIIAPESAQVYFNWESTRAAVVEVQVPFNLPNQVLLAIESILFNTSLIPNISSDSSGGGDATLANQTSIINALSAIQGTTFDTTTDSLEAIRNQGDTAWLTATGFSVLSDTDINNQVALALNTYDPPTNAELTAGINSILTQGNSAWRTATGFSTFDPNSDTVANVALVSAINGVTFPATFNNISAADVNNQVALALQTYDTATNANLSVGLNNILIQGNSAWRTATGFSTHAPGDIRTELATELLSIESLAKGEFIINSDGTAVQYTPAGAALATFNLFNFDGTQADPTSEQVSRRVPV